MSDAERIAEARAHLGAALSQTIPSDDQIIIGHIRDAYVALGGRPEDHVSQRAVKPEVDRGA